MRILFCLALLISQTVFAKRITLLQNKKGLHCKPVDKKSSLKYFTTDRWHEKLNLYFKDGKHEFVEMSRYLDYGVFFKDKKDKKNSLTHVFENGKVFLFWGRRYKMRERTCKDGGAHKVCEAPEVEKLNWHSERFELKLKGKDTSLKKYKVERYGIFPNDATYFHSTAVGSKESLTLIDYGGQFDLLLGEKIELNCKYIPPATKK